MHNGLLAEWFNMLLYQSGCGCDWCQSQGTAASRKPLCSAEHWAPFLLIVAVCIMHFPCIIRQLQRNVSRWRGHRE